MPFIPVSKECRQRCKVLEFHIQDMLQCLNYARFGKAYRQSIVKYIYCEEDDCVLVVLLSNGKLFIREMTGTDQCAIGKDILQELRNRYENLFLPPIDSINSFKELAALWEELHLLFLDDLIPMLATDSSAYHEVYTFFDCPAIYDGTLFNLSVIHDLIYCFSDYIKTNTPLYFINAHHYTACEFIQRISTLPMATPQSMHLLFGLPLRERPGSRKEYIYRKMLHQAQEAGASVSYLTCMDDLNILLEHEGTVQLITHFDYDSLFTTDLVQLEFKDIYRILHSKQAERRATAKAAIHAITCNNYHFFRQLLDSGIPHIIFSYHNLNSELISVMLHELYAGENARNIGWAFPYLDGRKQMHAVWSDVLRALLVQNKIHNQTILPI